ncbi:hypothetical protein [Flavobacterium cerinum]|uniref:DUF4252 domain-containing protein n=1 Tax=Flavobacterium cerinum TaxID=2502784 RepID=A0ABY5IPN8_9FLAO|nr:hypothetical protein [Flavobacterium cerinum]UUC44805.1 hypothetical protein NOX80_14360 [Flavobacterium cerinum]
MKDLIKIGLFLLIGTYSLNAQVKTEPDSIKFSNNNCATKLAREYMFKMGAIDSNDSKQKPLRSSELLKGTEFEKEINGVFLISPLTTHRKKLIVLKKGNQIKLLTFKNVSNSLIELISFLRDINTSNDELLKYIDSVQIYIESSKSTIKANNKMNNSDWIKCK